MDLSYVEHRERCRERRLLCDNDRKEIENIYEMKTNWLLNIVLHYPFRNDHLDIKHILFQMKKELNSYT